MKKYELTEETITIGSHTLHRVIALIDFGSVKKNDIGGWIENYRNLDQCGDAWVYGDAEVYGDAKVYGDAWVGGDAKVYSDADFIVFKNFWSSGRYLTWTQSNNMWRVGCFYGTGGELIIKAYKDSEVSGREYERVVRYVESILKDKKKTTKNQ